MGAQNKMRGAVGGDLFFQAGSHFPAQRLVVGKGILVDIDLPADAAIVAALLCNALKVLVIVWFYDLHSLILPYPS